MLKSISAHNLLKKAVKEGYYQEGCSTTEGTTCLVVKGKSTLSAGTHCHVCMYVCIYVCV